MMSAPETQPAKTIQEHSGRDLFVRQGIKLTHLRLILALKETGQISAAAHKLAISQPAASRLSAELERIVQVKLYDRHPRGVVLSEYGERLALRARNLLGELNEASRELAEMSSGMSGMVRIGSVTGPAVEMVLPTVKSARGSYPKISVTVTMDTSHNLAADLLADRLDFYLGRIPADQDPRQFHAAFVGDEPVSLIVRRDHPLTRIPRPSIVECVKYDWVLQPEGNLLRRTVEDYLIARAADQPNIFLSTSSIHLTLATIVETNAIAPIARSVADFFGRDGLGGGIRSLAVAKDLFVSPYSLITRANRTLSPASKVIYDLLAQKI